MTNLTDNLRRVCEYIKANDKHSDILDVFSEYLKEEMPLEVIKEICIRELTNIKEDEPSLTIKINNLINSIN